MRVLTLATALVGALASGVSAQDAVSGGNQYVTTHSMKAPLARNATAVYLEEPVIEEFHFHVYFWLAGDGRCLASCEAANRLRSDIVAAVARGEFVAVCDGVTEGILPGVDTADIPPVNMHPIGPHPAGSYEVWVPKEHLAAVMSFIMARRGELSVLFHPLSRHELEDHTGRAMWLGPSTRINLEVLSQDLGAPPAQYPRLALGYHGR